ncbi:MAG: hypothetical protein ACPGJV_00490 [Bacteriovoracaceae bacterium]
MFINVSKFRIISFILFLSVSLSTQVEAKRFASQFCEFELPPQWECALEETEWVCQSVNKNRKREAIIILAAKKRGSQDDLNQYKSYLSSKKTFSLPGGITQVSDPKYTKYKEISKHRWVDSLHLASEVPGFYTRYLATVKGELGVAVTFSVAKEHYDSYKTLFDKIVQTLRVFAVENKDVSKFRLGKKDKDIVGDLDDNYIPTEGLLGGVGQRKKKRGNVGAFGDNMMLIVLVVGGAIGFIVMKKLKSKKSVAKKTKKKSKKKKSS